MQVQVTGSGPVIANNEQQHPQLAFPPHWSAMTVGAVPNTVATMPPYQYHWPMHQPLHQQLVQVPVTMINGVPTMSPASFTYATYAVNEPLQYTTAAESREKSCYNCGERGHVGTECTQETLDDATQASTFSLDFTPLPLAPVAQPLPDGSIIMTNAAGVVHPISIATESLTTLTATTNNNITTNISAGTTTASYVPTMNGPTTFTQSPLPSTTTATTAASRTTRASTKRPTRETYEASRSVHNRSGGSNNNRFQHSNSNTSIASRK